MPCSLAAPAVVLSAAQPLLLRKAWFDPELAGCLRGHLRYELLKLMQEQAQDKGSAAVASAVADMKDYEEELAAKEQLLAGQVTPGE